MTTPTRTAKARLWRKIVTKVTKTITNTSDLGILLKVFKLAHSKVPTETIIISPVRAAMGIFSIKLAPNMMKTKSITEATIPESLALAPLDVFIRLCPIMAQPPMPENNPDKILAAP